MAVRECDMSGLMGVWNEIYEIYADYEDLTDDALIEVRPTIDKRITNALDLLNSACKISDDDVSYWIGD